MDKDSLEFFSLYNSDYTNLDYTLLVSAEPSKVERQCPFCKEYLSEDLLKGHSKDCMMYDYPTISIWWFLLPLFIMVVLIVAYIRSLFRK